MLRNCATKIVVAIGLMIIRCKIYFVFFYFRGLRKPWKYFYNKNSQIYGRSLLCACTSGTGNPLTCGVLRCPSIRGWLVQVYCTCIVGNFRGRKLLRISKFSRKFFLQNWGCVILWRHQQANCENLTFNNFLQTFSPVEISRYTIYRLAVWTMHNCEVHE